MDDEQKRKEDLEAAKGWLAIAKKNNNTMAIQILEKLFPELRESEDEKIRKSLIALIKEIKLQPLKRHEDWNGMLAWLEKQREQNPIEQDTETRDLWVYIREWNNKFGRLPKDEDELASCIQYVMKRQKPADKADALMSLDEAIEHCKEKSCGNNACALEHKQLEKWLTELKELKEQNPTWGEEDERMINLLIKIFEVNHPNGHFKVNPIGTTNMEAISTKKIVDWLKSLKIQKKRKMF